MKNFIIDAANEKIFFSIITESQSYTTTYLNSRQNFDKFVILMFNFLKIKETRLSDCKKIFINQGPGKFSEIRISISIAKALSLTNNIDLIGFCSKDIESGGYKNILKLEEKGLLIKDLIKPLYSS